MDFLGTRVTFPGYLSPSAWIEHGPFAMWLVRKLRPRRIVELGTHYGFSYFAMCEAVREEGLPTDCYAVDTWQGDEHAGHYDESVYESVFRENQKYSGFSHMLRKTFAEALADVEDGTVDLLHVDGRHFYDDVKEDFESWIPKLSGRAVVLFHDTEVYERDFGVHRFWAEIREKRTSLNFLHGHGLGVLLWGEDIAPGIRDFADLLATGEGAQEATEFFAFAGAAMGIHADLVETRRRLEVSEEELLTRRAEAKRLTAVVAELQDRLREAHANPGRIIRGKAAAHVLYGLASQQSLFSQRKRDKFRRSALKRDPLRAIPGVDPQAPEQDESVDAAPDSARPANLPSRPHDRAKDTVMVVSHDATRTGAPVLAVNLVEQLSDRYNVVAVVLGEGALTDQFQAAATHFHILRRGPGHLKALSCAIKRIASEHRIQYALVNSVESRGVLPGLHEAGVPTVAILHEFASNTRPESAFMEVFDQADHVVFSTRLTLEDALRQCRIRQPHTTHILPQGKCAIPGENADDGARAAERRRLEAALRPGGADDPQFVVLGAGVVQTRKGVDLFLECATRLIAGPGGGRYRFVWIGDGYDPEADDRLSVYLADQILRAGLSAQVAMLPPTSEIEHAYALSDMLLLSSRLDPLPNVAIDCLLLGKPIVCFARTTGIADFLSEAGLGPNCVARYLDTADMAEKVRALAADADRYAEVSRHGRDAAMRVFDFPAYVERLDSIARGGGALHHTLEDEVETIRRSGAFRADFFAYPGLKAANETDMIRSYLTGSRSGRAVRKPMPGFHPLIHASEAGDDSDANPFVSFLEAGRPEGPWRFPVIDQDSPIDPEAAGRLRIGLHVHVFYLDEFRDILRRIELNGVRPDLHLTTTAELRAAVEKAAGGYSGHVAEIAAVPNRGRDIGPFLTQAAPALAEGYDIAGHLHTKRTSDIADRAIVGAWVNFLMETTLGGAGGGPMLDRIVTAMDADPGLGIVYPDDPNVIGWTENRGAAENLAGRLGLDRLPDHFNFPVGNMFWMRSGLLRRFVGLGLDWPDYPPEPLPYDGTVLHALERLIGILPGQEGLRTAVTNVRGMTR